MHCAKLYLFVDYVSNVVKSRAIFLGDSQYYNFSQKQMNICVLNQILIGRS